MPLISAPRVLVDGRFVGPAALVVEGGTIQDVLIGGDVPAEGERVELTSGVLTAGLVDLQINGAFGVDFAGASTDEWASAAKALPSTGVTAFQPTFITAPLDELLDALRHAKAVHDLLRGEPVARITGVHLEGPFISPEQPGVHPVENMRPPRPHELDRVLAGTNETGVLGMVTLAPELPGALVAVERLTAAGVVVSVGHSNASAAQVRAAADAGATMITHVFNAQRGLGHREPGVAGQALTDPRFTVGLIADLHHVTGQICLLVTRLTRGRLALVTDATAATGMPPGSYVLGGLRLDVAENDVPRAGDGNIAGSVLTLDQGIRNLVGLGADPDGVIDAATRIPADTIGRDDLGRLRPGAAADLVWWSDDFWPLRTWVDGTEVYAAPEVMGGVP